MNRRLRAWLSILVPFATGGLSWLGGTWLTGGGWKACVQFAMLGFLPFSGWGLAGDMTLREMGPADKTWLRRTVTLGGAPGLTSFAAWLAGRKRHPDMWSQWTDQYLTQRAEGAPAFFILAGYLLAALRIRATDIAKPLWARLDWLVAKTGRINTTVTLIGGAQTVYLCAGGDGLYGFLNGGELCVGVSGSGLFLLLRYLRKSRGIEIAGRESGDQDDEK